MKDQLIRDFDYDIWANERWLVALPTLPFAPRAEVVLRHILSCHRYWLGLAWSEDELSPEPDDLRQALREAAVAWQTFLALSDPIAFAAIPMGDGKVEFWMVGDVARHVLTHGTYHRGHLRGLAEAANTLDFPDTDRDEWYLEVATPG